MDWRSIRRVDIALAVLAAVVQIGITARLARHREHVRALDVYGYLLLAAGPAALLVRRRQPVPVLMLAFATTRRRKRRGPRDPRHGRARRRAGRAASRRAPAGRRLRGPGPAAAGAAMTPVLLEPR